LNGSYTDCRWLPKWSFTLGLSETKAPVSLQQRNLSTRIVDAGLIVIRIFWGSKEILATGSNRKVVSQSPLEFSSNWLP
jgi:hypothetical protein